jgi:hypothetical protein
MKPSRRPELRKIGHELFPFQTRSTSRKEKKIKK